jgi:hypothetical protein
VRPDLGSACRHYPFASASSPSSARRFLGTRIHFNLGDIMFVGALVSDSIPHDDAPASDHQLSLISFIIAIGAILLLPLAVWESSRASRSS